MDKVATIARGIILVLLCGFAAPSTLAQSDLVTQPPPPIPFTDWRFERADDDSEIFSTHFPSAVTTAFEKNDIVSIKAMLPADRTGKVPVVIVLHFWGATDSRIDQAMGAELNRRGIGAVLMSLPYHLERTPEGYKSGELAIRPDVNSLIETMRQSVLDVRRTVDWINSKSEFNGNQIGIVGTSLGGIVASLAFNVDPRLTSASFLLAGVDLAGVLWSSSRVVALRENLRRQGLSESLLRDKIKVIEPLTYQHASESRRTFVVSARFDTIVPRDSTEQLIKMLGSPEVLWLETGHVGGFIVESQIFRSVASFFDSVFKDRPFKAPTRFYSPTIRVGIHANGPYGLQLAAGLDIWRSNSQGDGFASIMLTPRGPQGFIGYKIKQGLSAGIAITPKRTSWGVFWSLVL